MAPRFDPLNEGHYAAAAQGCAECAMLREHLESLIPLGIDVSEPMARLDALDTFFNGVVARRGVDTNAPVGGFKLHSE
jgi:hypothetical protein